MKIRILALLMIAVMLLSSCNLFGGEAHTHSFADSYSSNETHHWYACSCGEKDGFAEHAWNNGVVTIIPTPDSDGIKTFTCMECGRKMAQKIAYTPDDDQGGNGGNSGNVVGGGLSFMKSTLFKMDDRLPKIPLTLEAEIYLDPSISSRAGAIFGNFLGTNRDWLLEIHENGVPRFYYTDAGGNVKDIYFNNVDVRTGDWVHIAFTFDFENGKMSIYLDGELAQSINCTADIDPRVIQYEFVVGSDARNDNSNYFRGMIRAIALYSDVRTVAEIATSAANGINSYADDILVHYVLNETSGEDDIIDLSSNGINISKEWIDSHEVSIDYAYSFAVVGDTQWLSKYTPAKLEGIYDWILENQESKKIAHVFGLGDITEDWNTANKEQEWIRAYEYISKLDGKVSYSLVRGNHDESKYFIKYFANETYMSQFDGFMNDDDIRNSYMLVTIGSTDYLFLTIDFGAGNDILDWANEVVLAHPDRRVIITTHGYQAFNQDRINSTNVPSYGGTGASNDVDTSVGESSRDYNNGDAIWEKFVSRHPNIFLIMSGHTPFEDIILLQDKGNHGNVVNQMVIDPQWMDPQKGGVGMVCMLYFTEDGSQMEVEWISTDTGKYYQEQNQFKVDLTDSFKGTPHEFEDSYNEKSHHKACYCGYIYNAEPHIFDGGVLNADGYMVYSCECGYQRIASATDDPVALELQALLEKYYNNGVYYKEVTIGESVETEFYNAESTHNSITLQDIILGKYGDLKLDLGWNYYEGVYSSSNENTLRGFELFVAPQMSVEFNKVTAEELNHHIIIKLYSGENVVATVEIGLYATTTLVKHDGTVIDTLYTKSNDKGMCEVATPEIDGFVSEYDYFILSTIHDELTKTVYYSTIDVWDGKTVSEGLQGSGTEEDPFLVTSGADLAYIASIVNAAEEKAPNFASKHFKMTQSIDLNGHTLYIGSYTGWGTRRGFYGLFDGNHCTIRGLSQNRSLFGTIETGYLKNLSVYGKISNSTDEATGGIVAYVANGGALDNLTNYVTLNATNTLGGVVGNAENQASTVINCVNYGNVTGTSWIIGGVAGSGGHDMKNCVNFGTVISTGNDCVGGIAGSTKNTGKIENCYNYGDIRARGKVGGIIGQGNKPIMGCVNYGNIDGVWAMAGIVGYTKNSDSISISDCVNFGNVTASSTGIGGIFGILEGGTSATGTAVITNCVNNGNVSGSWGIGGIAGDTPGTIMGCVNNGTLNASGDLGGIIGKAYGKITECTNNGNVIGTSVNVGGIVGHLHVATYLDVINTTNENNGMIVGATFGNIVGVIE